MHPAQCVTRRQSPQVPGSLPGSSLLNTPTYQWPLFHLCKFTSQPTCRGSEAKPDIHLQSASLNFHHQLVTGANGICITGFLGRVHRIMYERYRFQDPKYSSHSPSGDTSQCGKPLLPKDRETPGAPTLAFVVSLTFFILPCFPFAVFLGSFSFHFGHLLHIYVQFSFCCIIQRIVNRGKVAKPVVLLPPKWLPNPKTKRTSGWSFMF